jgi:site-specific DNA recombinase
MELRTISSLPSSVLRVSITRERLIAETRSRVAASGDNLMPLPMRAERHAKHLRVISPERKWLQKLIPRKAEDAAAIAAREGRSMRSVNMMISLAFVAPDIIEAAVAGRLPRGIGVTRLVDLLLSWAKQKEALGLPGRF